MKKIEEMYTKMINGIEDATSFETMLKISISLSEEVDIFRHCPY
jgi:hypothetical protein